jgi:hypothetical protein
MAVLGYIQIPEPHDLGIFRSFILILEACQSNT